MKFIKFLEKKLKNKDLDAVEKDFINDSFRTKDFRDFKTLEEFEDYLTWKKACRAAKLVGQTLFIEWAKEENKFDGLNRRDIERIKTGLRKAWGWCHSRKLVIERSTDKKGFAKCERCHKRCPKIFVDHIEPVGMFDGEYIERLFVSSTQMQGLCAKCHKLKTKDDLELIKAKKMMWGF